MILPDTWGQGAIFTYSGATGNKNPDNYVSARLCTDSFAFRFLTENKCTLKINSTDADDIIFNVVMTDYISSIIKYPDYEINISVMFISQDTIMICSDREAGISLEFEKNINIKKSKKYTLYCDDKESVAMSEKCENDLYTYVLCFGKKASDKAIEEIKKNAKEEEEKILNFYSSLPEFRIPNERIEKLYYRCASVLLSGINSAEGLIKYSYAGAPYEENNALKPFFSSLCTLGLRHIMPEYAKSTLESILHSAAADGMISSKITTTHKNNDIFPPTLAWCFWELYLVNNDKEMLENAYAPLKKYIHYLIETRDINKNYLYEWQLSDSENEFGSESTMDNSPRFDDGVILDSVDFSSYVANEAQHMKLIAEEIDKHGESLYWNVMFERIKTAVNELLFDEDDKIYYDKAVVSNMFKKIKTSSSFLPLYAGICENRHAMALLKLLNTHERFNLRHGIPTVSGDSDTFSNDMCRGPLNIAVNYMISKGLEKYEMHDKSNEIKSKLLETVIREYESDGVIYEFYSADGSVRAANLTRKGYSTNFPLNQKTKNHRDYALTAAIIIDMLLSKSKKLPSRQ